MPVNVVDQLQESEASFRLLFEHSTSAVAVHEIVLNEAGQPVDFIFLSANPAFETQTGLRCVDIIGRRVTEILPGIEKSNVIEVYGMVVQTGESVSFDQYFESLKRHYIINAYPIGERRFATAFTDITARKKAEEELRASEESLRATLSSMEDLLFVLDNNGVIVDYQTPQADVLFVPPEEFMGKSYREVMPPDVAAKIDQALIPVTTKGESAMVDYSIELNGKVLWFNARFSPRRNSNNQVDGVTVVIRDISVQKRAEEALRTSEESYRGLFNTMTDAIYVQDIDGRFLDVNDGAVRMYGYPREFFLGKTPEFLSAPGMNDMGDVFRRVKHAFSTGETQQFEFWGLRSNGEIFPKDVQVFKGSYFGQDALITLASDNTERKATEMALRNSESRYRKLIESQGEGAVVVDLNEVFMFANPAADEIFGVKTGSLIGRSLLEFVDEERLAIVRAESTKRGEGISSTYELEIIHDNGQRRILIVTASPQYDERGNSSGSFSIFRDITERKEMETALRTSEALLKSTLESTGDGILVVDNTGKAINANRRFAELWRIPPSLLEAHDDQKLLDYVIDQLVDPQLFISKVMLLYLSADDDFDTLQFKDGRVFDRFSCPLMQNDQVAGRVWSFRDVSERKRAERELRLARFSIDRSGDAVYWINSSGLVVDSNENACNVFGFNADSQKDVFIWNIADDITAQSWSSFWSSLKKEKRLVREANRKHKDGKSYVTEVSSYFIEFESQELICTFLRDISDRKRNEIMQSVLYEISEATGRSSTLLELLEVMQQQIGRLINTENFYIALYDEETELYTFAFVRDNESIDPTTIPPQKLKRSLTDYVRRSGTPVLFTNSDLQAIFNSGEVDCIGVAAKLWMGIPLILSDRAIGVVGIQTYSEDVTYTAQDKDLMSIIASSIAMAIERKRSEESIIRLRGAVESSGEVIFMTDRQGVFTYVNPEFTKLYGYTAQEVIGKQTPQVLKRGNDDIRNYERILEDLLQGRLVRSELINYTKDGKAVTMDISASPIYDEKKVINGTLAVQRDITLQKQAELELRENESKLAEAQRIAKVGSWESWIETGEMKASDELHRVFGLDPVQEKVTRFGILPNIIHPEDRERVAAAMTSLVQSRVPLDIDFRAIMKDETIKYIHEHAQIKKDREGRDVIFGTAQDVTEQKNAEEERKALEIQLRRTQRLETIGTLAGGIAHDFNNILTPILGYADMAMISVSEDHPVRSDLEHVIKAAQRAKELVQQILTFSRQGDQVKRPLEIHLIVKEVLELMRASLPSTIEIKQNVDSACGCVLADPSQIHQVLMNLCTNAFHAMRDCGGTLEIGLRIDYEFAKSHPGKHDQPFVKLSVRDTGVGMSKSVIDRVFEPFFTTKGVGEGTGLGLSVVHGIITNHGGEITVESELGKGTTFNIYLPQAKQAPSCAPASAASLTGGNEHILFVDDEEEITMMVKQMLENSGYQVTTRNSSVDALKLFSASPREFDLVICDQTMPHLAGNELASELLAIRPDLPILMMTGYSESFSPADARRLGIRQYLTKPIAAVDLDAAIRKHLGNPNLTEV